MNPAIIAATAVIAIGAGLALGMYLRGQRAQKQLDSAENQAKRKLEEAKDKAEAVKRNASVEAKEYLLKARTKFEEETKAEKRELTEREKRLLQRDDNLDKKVDLLENKEKELRRREQSMASREQNVEKKSKEYQHLTEEAQKRLEFLAGMSREEAKKELISSLINEARHETVKELKIIEENLRDEADKKAKRIISIAIQRYAGDYIQERAISVINLPNDDMKGRIIGREGRNIRALEAATGVDLIIDDTPEAVVLSGFDPVRREVARIALQKLIEDGRIHPTRIEEVVKKANEEVNSSIKEAGDQALFDLGIHGLHPELTRLIGRLRYRYSFAQNVWRHSMEVGFLSGLMAAELGLNVKEARRAGLLHDIGKAVDHEVEGSHAAIGAQLARKYGESAKVLNAIASHHEEEQPQYVLSYLVAAADALSGARPGARREMMENYIRRLEDLEKISTSFPGVEKSYAIQAGREIRVLVEHKNVSDNEAVMLSKEIARKIEQELSYPGQIKVTVIRETRAVEYAK